jgi:hypothetical protein
MATNYGVNATLAQNNPVDKIDASDAGGRVRCIYDTFTLTADLAAADVIKLGSKIPAGARVVGGYLHTADLDGSGGTICLGYAASADGAEGADDDAFINDLDVTSAAYTNFHTAPLVGLGKKFAGACDLQLSTVGDTDATTGAISVFLFYTLD